MYVVDINIRRIADDEIELLTIKIRQPIADFKVDAGMKLLGIGLRNVESGGSNNGGGDLPVWAFECQSNRDCA